MWRRLSCALSMGLLAFVANGCGSSQSNAPPVMTEAQHTHYHVHAADASHDHAHDDGSALGGHAHPHAHEHAEE